jgi:hypothetical protein
MPPRARGVARAPALQLRKCAHSSFEILVESAVDVVGEEFGCTVVGKMSRRAGFGVRGI